MFMRTKKRIRSLVPPVLRPGLYSSYLLVRDAEYRQVVRRMRTLRNRYRGRRCFVMGNGPSLNRTDLSLLQDDYVWGLNRCHLLFDRIPWRPAFIVSVDRLVVPDIAPEVESLMHQMPRTLFFFPLFFRRNGVLKGCRNTYWFYEAFWKGYTFSPDPSRWVSSVCTVAITALQLAAYMGFSPIYLVGCDTSYKVNETVRRAEENRDFLTSTENDDDNHFDPRYFGKDRRWHEPYPERMIRHYCTVRKVCEPLGIKIYNATVGGELEVFPRVDYRKLF